MASGPKSHPSGAPYLSTMLSDAKDLARESRKRKKDYDFTAVAKSRVEELKGEGWEFDRYLKKRIRLKRPKEHAVRLKNRVWLLLYKLGYKELSKGLDFEVCIKQRSTPDRWEHIDVLAKDDETVLIAECCSLKVLGRKNLHDVLERFAMLKGPIARAVKSHYGDDFKPKILWFFVTDNIVWSKADLQRARKEKIHCVTDRELRYYNQIASHLGKAARFQFLAEYLDNQRVPGLTDCKVPAIKGKLGGRVFYSFLISAKHLLKISFVNHRSLNDPAGAPSYQRLISKGRLRRVAGFIEGGGYFPTNLLVNFPTKVRFDREYGEPATGLTYGHLYLPDKYKSAWIIDGQHRLYGYAALEEPFLEQPLIVVAFQGLRPEEEADLFVTINHEQKSVPRNLLDELEGDLKWGSEVPTQRLGAIAARVIGLINDDVGEPFHNRVTAQGISATTRMCLNVPQIKGGLKRSGLIGRAGRKIGDYEPGALAGSTDLETVDRLRSVLNLYFRQVQDANFNLWDAGRDGHVCTNAGVQGYIMLLAAILDHLESTEEFDSQGSEPTESVERCLPYLKPVLDFLSMCGQEDAQRVFKVPYGAGGPRQYFFRLCRIVRESFPKFVPSGFHEWEETQSREKIERAERQIKKINVQVQRIIFDVFRDLYGEAEYFERGVPDHNMRVAAFSKQQQNPLERRLSLEHYLDFIDYKKIVERSEHWGHFEPLFNIPEKGEKGRAKNLTWMDRVNSLRRIPAHPTQERQFQLDDFAYLDWLERELEGRFRKQGLAHTGAGDL